MINKMEKEKNFGQMVPVKNGGYKDGWILGLIIININ